MLIKKSVKVKLQTIQDLMLHSSTHLRVIGGEVYVFQRGGNRCVELVPRGSAQNVDMVNGDRLIPQIIDGILQLRIFLQEDVNEILYFTLLIINPKPNFQAVKI